MIFNYDHLIDAKINAIHFNFDAIQYMMSQNLEVCLQNLTDKIVCYKLIFLNVSSFCVHIKAGKLSIDTNSYEADSLYIEELKKIESNNNHQHWIIKLIDNIGYIEIFCDDISVN